MENKLSRGGERGGVRRGPPVGQGVPVGEEVR
jgi:hypothetical protein